ncbi:ABC transporter ATP-binding protein [Reyranella sp. CPCC 100927]|uniref:ABC transporter ATP-binding protein n=1 Tax=Reyranella sp. CPCC 100927 TaxID=2599616 RepID=UPI0011B71729|nr:ABC transporter ATP-binding protein [Reyranella sp. CPCC 100927]TWT03951.1 ABC transporter ATP-binding protein [Reyranella sp. CPCC 100927]
MDRKLLTLAGPIGGPIAVSVMLGLLVTACYVAQGLCLALALAALFRGEALSAAITWIIAFAAVVGMRGILVWATEIAAQRTARRTKEHLRERLLRKLLDLGPGYAAQRQTGDLQTTIVTGVEALESYYSRYLPTIFVAVASCAGVLLCLAYVDWRSAILLGAFVVALPIADHLWLRWRMPKSSGIFAAMGAFAAYLLDSLQGIVTLKAFDATARRRAELAGRAAVLRRESMTTLAVTLMRTGLTGLIGLGGVAVVLAVNAWRVSAGDLAPVALFMTLFLAREAFRPLDRLEKEFHTAWSASGAVGPIADLLDARPLVREPITAKPLPSRSDIRFDNVTFAYGEDAPALSSLSFTVKEREFVALVGPSGAGKSTVVALLLRFFDPQAGMIRIGGVDLRDMTLAELRSLVSVVSQDVYLFHGTVEDNLRIAKPDASTTEIHAAAKAAHIDDFITGLPQGYATEVGERGAHLSGGQRQRIAIARALLKDAPILLLDEATSNVDPASERAIQDALETLARRRTALVIAHRLSTIRSADRILVLQDGKVVEQGGHAALAASGGLYSKLTFAQGEAA